MAYKLRRSRIYVPGNNPRMLSTCGLFEADVITIDLEDSIAPDQKLAARWLVAEALKDLEFGRSEVTVRINALSTPWGKKDLEAIIPTRRVEAIYLPKAESPEDIKQLDSILEKLERENGIEVGRTKIVPILESAKGVWFAYDIAVSSDRVVALSFGGEDYTRDVGGERTPEGTELMWARSQVVAGAKAAGKQALDTVYSNVDDLEGLYRNTVMIKRLGFDGKAAIHPNQIPVIHEAFNPTQDEIEHALRVIEAIEEAKAKGSGVVALGRKMIDKPVVERAERVLTIAYLAGMIKEEEIPESIRESIVKEGE